MSNLPTDMDPGEGKDTLPPVERLVWVSPVHALGPAAPGDISLGELCRTLWRGRIWIVATAMVFAAISIVYALLATEWYRSEVLLAPTEDIVGPNVAGQIPGFALLAGLSVDRGNTPEAIATLRSRELAREFIEDRALLPLFFAEKWDVEAGRWRGGDTEESPDIRDAVDFFLKKVLDVQEIRPSGMVTLAIEWKDPELAAEWAEGLVERLNARLRERTLRTAEANVAFLQAELEQTSLVMLQQSIGRLLETELQKVMLARANEEFAFRTIDGASVPKNRAWPKRTIIVIVTTLLGGILGVCGVLFVHAVRVSSPGSRLEIENF